MTACNVEFLAGWAVGAGDFVYPDGIAFPLLGDSAASRFVMIEVHYDNTNFHQGTPFVLPS